MKPGQTQEKTINSWQDPEEEEARLTDVLQGILCARGEDAAVLDDKVRQDLEVCTAVINYTFFLICRFQVTPGPFHVKHVLQQAGPWKRACWVRQTASDRQDFDHLSTKALSV